MTFLKVILKPRSGIAKFLLGCGIIAFISLGFLDYLPLIKDFLDSSAFSFKVGETRFSIYILLKSLLTIITIFWITSIFSEFVEKRIQKISDIKFNNRSLIIKVFQLILYFGAFIFSLNFLGIDLKGLAIFSGALGIGIGLGLQKISANFISGLVLLFEKSIEHGDLINLPDGSEGFVKRIEARFTLIETLSGKEIMIPNETFMTNSITNSTHTDTSGRIDIPFNVSYESDLDFVIRLIEKEINELPDCSKEKKAKCFLTEFGSDGINLMVHFWIGNVKSGRFFQKSEVIRCIWRSLKDNNISIPFPQRDIHIKNDISKLSINNK